jgi:hypothetical protein
MPDSGESISLRDPVAQCRGGFMIHREKAFNAKFLQGTNTPTLYNTY